MRRWQLILLGVVLIEIGILIPQYMERIVRYLIWKDYLIIICHAFTNKTEIVYLCIINTKDIDKIPDIHFRKVDFACTTEEGVVEQRLWLVAVADLHPKIVLLSPILRYRLS